MDCLVLCNVLLDSDVNLPKVSHNKPTIPRTTAWVCACLFSHSRANPGLYMSCSLLKFSHFTQYNMQSTSFEFIRFIIYFKQSQGALRLDTMRVFADLLQDCRIQIIFRVHQHLLCYFFFVSDAKMIDSAQYMESVQR